MTFTECVHAELNSTWHTVYFNESMLSVHRGANGYVV
jgi:hypothetical protein